ncbi:unnamed protein product [Clonostachys solani]|uniref:Transcription factor tau subunit sfc6 n=1 Tax=Clonostachys solani TaxID=160281 RepID=A0A9N9ZEW7_9HYPO|nr:unnamed protein product [Clonostachys solani]
MRTRKSNRNKRYTVEKYDFEDSEDEQATPPSRVQKAGGRNDDEFDATAEPEDQDEAIDAESSHSDATASEGDAPKAQPRQRPRTAKPPKTRKGAASATTSATAYVNIEPASTDSPLGKGYSGLFDRGFRGLALVAAWYGPEEERIQKGQEALNRWVEWALLPPKDIAGPPGSNSGTFWSTTSQDNKDSLCQTWLSRLASDQSSRTVLSGLTAELSRPYLLNPGSLPVLLGPHDDQVEFSITAGDSIGTTSTGLPHNSSENVDNFPTGWMLDTGGLVLNLDWAQQRDVDAVQLLAVAVVPHLDQEVYTYDEATSGPDFQMQGTVQIWAFQGRRTDQGSIEPSNQHPRLQKTLCLYGGRVRVVRWSPACRHLAILSGGTVYVVDPGEDENGAYEEIQQPIATLSFGKEDVKATSLTWVTFNRLAIGYSDGSIALWSIYPACLLSRHPVHHSPVINIESGYPSLPYLVASSPIGGFVKIVDLRSPSLETSEAGVLSVNTIPNLLAYSDHLLGFYALSPTSNVLNTMIGFMHHAHFPIVRRVFTSDRFVTCLSIGRTHPHLLVGTTDGSLWAMNPQLELFQGRRDLSDRIRVLQHEHRPAENFPPGSPASERGVSRIIQGFKPEKNRHTKLEPPGKKKKGKGKGGEEDAEGDEVTGHGDPSRGIVHEPLTRITVVKWNPNEGYGTWAAVAMASGLVKVMNLGLEDMEE